MKLIVAGEKKEFEEGLTVQKLIEPDQQGKNVRKEELKIL